MKMRLNELVLHCKQGVDRISFGDFSYFYGQMGAGKSTIARLIDYCLAGDLDLTPALQSEFVAATLNLEVEDTPVSLTRNRESDQIRAQWEKNGEPFEAMIPARKGHTEIVPDTGIYVLSDLFFFLADARPPKVRRSKIKEESELERLSIRALLWYCYLDQDSMDSSFFNLDADSNPFKKLTSRDVLRFVVGFHQERVAELEAELETIREQRLRFEGAAKAIREVLATSELSTSIALEVRRVEVRRDIAEVEAQINRARESPHTKKTHAIDELRERCRQLEAEVARCELADAELAESIAHDEEHRKTLLSLSARFKRANSARAMLLGVEYEKCPRCDRPLLPVGDSICTLCGREESSDLVRAATDDAIDVDVANSVKELVERIRLQKEQRQVVHRKRSKLRNAKEAADQELNRASAFYDSTYLSAALELEKKRAALSQRLLDLNDFEALVLQVDKLAKDIEELVGREHTLKAELIGARASAEKDTKNLDSLKLLFLDCLVRSRIPGFYEADIVELKSPNFLPEVLGADKGDLAVTSFSNLGSGGKKSLFKCCFAVAMHRLAVENEALLPTILIIDSPMKNISERENRQQFVRFHKMMHELAEDELKGTQVVIIDKELHRPAKDFSGHFSARHMTPDDKKNPPLIRYYRGK